MHGEAVVTLTAGTAAAVFGGGVALANIAAGLFFSGPDTALHGNRAIPPARRPGAMRVPGVPGSRSPLSGQADVPAILHTRPLDHADGFIGAGPCLSDVCTQTGDVHDAATAGGAGGADTGRE
jgi:hypothetical protein